MNPMPKIVDDAPVVVCCGSGGVGKTTTAAALGLAAARRGRRAVVVTIDPARRLADALGLHHGLASEPERVAVDADGELWATMLDTAAMLERVVIRHAADAEQAARIAENRLFRNLAESMSGTQEYMATEALYELATDDRFDIVIVDTPPSRNALDFLESPNVLARFLSHKVFKALMLPTRTSLKLVGAASQAVFRQLGRIVGNDVVGDAATFFQAFAGMEAGFQERAEAVTALLRAESTRFVLVASPQHDTVTEATWFADQLRDAGFGVDAAIVNRLVPEFGPGTAADAGAKATASDEATAAIWRNLADLRHLAAAQRASLQPLRDVVDDIVEVPQLADDIHDLAGLDRIGTHLL